jgi:hypothetical protein
MVEFVIDMVLCIVLWCYQCHIIVWKIHAPTLDKIYDLKDSFYDELEHIFNKFPKCNKKILLREFNAKVGREDFLKWQFGMKVYIKLVMIIQLE